MGGGGGVRVLRASGRQNIRNKLSGRLFYLIVLCVFFYFHGMRLTGPINVFALGG